MDTGDKIREKRKSKGWSQEQLAKKAKVSRNYISEIETGQKKNPTIEPLLRIVKALDISLLKLNDEYSLTKTLKLKRKK